MIGWVAGALLHGDGGTLLIAGSDLGYEVQVPEAASYLGLAQGERVELYTHLAVREDGQTLYGFFTLQERQLFRLLLKIRGLGPALALQILGDMGTNELIAALRSGDANRLTAVRGIGRKTAERMLLEIGDSGDLPAGGEPVQVQDARRVVLEALGNLGIRQRDAQAAVDSALAAEPELNEEQLLRAALSRTRSS